jgi:Flp pilus assembly protein TadG
MRIVHIARESKSLFRRVLVDESGAALVEFALVSPLLIILMAATVIFTWVFINYATVSFAAGTGAQVITTERLNITSTNWTPYTDTVNAVKSASSILDQTVLGQTGNIVVSINNTTCTTDAACQPLLTAITNTTTQASVTVSYPCDPIAKSNPFTVLWLTFGNCSLTTKTTGVVQ